jgi:hypothetical protein
MRFIAFAFFKSFAGRLIILALVCGLFLAGMLFAQSASADSGGFPTPTETLFVFPTWTPLPSPTPTFILLPTQPLSQSGQTAQKALAAPAEGEQVAAEPQAQSSGLGTGSKFAIGLAVGLAFVGLGVLVYWLLRRTGVLG